jgi:opacity protein-like surface antigen
MRTLAALACFAIMATTTARAEVEPGFYAGLSAGHSRLEIGDEELSVEANDISHRIFGGYAFGRYFALEVEYFNGGELSEDLLDVGLEFGVNGFVGSGLARLPVNDTFAVFARLGFAAYEQELELAGFGSGRESESDLVYGLGVTAAFGSRWEGRLEYEAIDASDLDFSMLSVSALYRF